MFKKETYINRRQTLRNKVNSGIILILGNEESPMNYHDNGFHFRQDSSFSYYFGLNNAGMTGIIDIDSGEEFIFGNDFTIEDIIWMGVLPTIKELSESVGIQKTGNTTDLDFFLKRTQHKGRKIHYLPSYRAEHDIKIFNWLGIHPNEISKNASLELRLAVISQRNYKTAEEIIEIEKGVNISVDMHIKGMQMAKPGMLEAEIAGAVEGIALEHDGHVAFPVIATINGQTLHNHHHGNRLKSGDLFLLDAGAETPMYYAGDLSSTFPVDPKFTSQQKDIYQLSLNAHDHAISLLKPGRPFKEIHVESCKVIAEGMKNLGLMKGNVDDAVEAGAHAMFFPCGLGHMMGLDIHDMEGLGEEYVGYDGEAKSTQFGLKSLRLGRKLEPGFVLTIEPGIYFIPELIDKWKAENKFTEFLNYDEINKYRNFSGCRNEEDFLITETGAKLLGKPKPKSIADVENIRNSG